MFNKNNQSKRSSALATYRAENSYFISYLKRIQTYISRLQQLDEYEKSKVLGYFNSFQWSRSLDANSRDNQLQLFDSLQYEVSTVTKLLNELVTSLEEENKVLSNHLKNLQPDSVEVDSEVMRLLQNYNHRQSEVWSELSQYLPNIVNEEEKIIGIVEKGIEDNVQVYIKQFKDFEETIQSEPKPDEIVRGLISMIFFLHKYIEAQEHYSKDAQDDFLNEVFKLRNKKDNCYKFAKNFFSLSKGSEITYEAKQIYDTIQGTPYSQLDDDSKKQIDKFLSNTLKKLIKGFSKAVKEKAEAITKEEEDVSEEKKTYEALVLQLIDIIRKEGKYLGTNNKPISSLQNFKIELHSGGNLTFKEFDQKMKDKSVSSADKKRLLGEIISSLNSLLNSDKKDSYYKDFMDYQVNQGVGIIKSDRSDDKVDDSDEFKQGEKFESGNIKDFIEEAIGNVVGPNGLNGLESVIAHSEDETISQDQLDPFKQFIIQHLNTIGKNLKKYNEEGHINSDNYDSSVNMLKTLISRWKLKNSQVKDIKQLVELTKQVCNMIRNG